MPTACFRQEASRQLRRERSTANQNTAWPAGCHPVWEEFSSSSALTNRRVAAHHCENPRGTPACPCQVVASPLRKETDRVSGPCGLNLPRACPSSDGSPPPGVSGRKHPECRGGGRHLGIGSVDVCQRPAVPSAAVNHIGRPDAVTQRCHGPEYECRAGSAETPVSRGRRDHGTVEGQRLQEQPAKAPNALEPSQRQEPPPAAEQAVRTPSLAAHAPEQLRGPSTLRARRVPPLTHSPQDRVRIRYLAEQPNAGRVAGRTVRMVAQGQPFVCVMHLRRRCARLQSHHSIAVEMAHQLSRHPRSDAFPPLRGRSPQRPDWRPDACVYSSAGVLSIYTLTGWRMFAILAPPKSPTSRRASPKTDTPCL